MTVRGGGGNSVRFEAAAYSWIKGTSEDTVMARQASPSTHSFRVELRDSYIHDAAWPVPGGGIRHQCGVLRRADRKQRIVTKANKVMVARLRGWLRSSATTTPDDGFITEYRGVARVKDQQQSLCRHHILFRGTGSFNYGSTTRTGTRLR